MKTRVFGRCFSTVSAYEVTSVNIGMIGHLNRISLR